MRMLFIQHDWFEAGNSPPLGMMYIAQFLRSSGIEVDFFNQDIFHNSNEELRDFIVNGKYNCVGASFSAARLNRMWDFYANVREACDEIDALFIMGGHGPSAIPEYTIDRLGADAVVVGEGELTTLELMQVLSTGSRDFTGVKGLVWKDKNGNKIVNPSRRMISNINVLPFPAHDLVPMKEYTQLGYMGRLQQNLESPVSAYIITSRGCVGNCSFCYRLFKGVRVRDISRVMEEVKFLHYTYGVNFIYFCDELFGLTPARIREFCREVEKLHFDLYWACATRVEVLQDPDIPMIMKNSNCTSVGIGLESMDQNVLDLMGKKTTVEQNIIAVDNCKDAGLLVALNFLWAMPGDTIESLHAIARFIKEKSTGNECRTVRPATPFPGCPLYYKAIAMGKLLGPDDFFTKFTNADRLVVNFTDIPEEAMYEELYKVNCALIDDFVTKAKSYGDYHSTNPDELKEQFYSVYFTDDYKTFRGVR
jgi:radical SAM superfamily enzyme YgiQ (UPF0313 family)